MSSMAMTGLSPEQAPPLRIPALFFLSAPVFVIVVGIAFLTLGDAALLSTNAPTTLALIHLGTLGFFAMTMFGALYQMIPVVAGIPVKAPRLAYGVYGLLIALLLALTAALYRGEVNFFRVALILGVAVLVLFALPIAFALGRAPIQNPSVNGLRLAVAGLFGVFIVGLAMAYGRGFVGYYADWNAWRTTHVALGFLVWIGGLISAVSWQVAPMFYLTPPLPRWSQRLSLGSALLVLVIAPVALGVGAGERWIAVIALPAAGVQWLVHPAVVAVALRRRRRKSRDASMAFWQLALAVAPFAFIAGIVANSSDDARAPVVFGWLVLWGWGGAIIHGMGVRILPFLTWFHRLAPWVGHRPVPPMRRLLSQGRIWSAWILHVLTLVAGCVAAVGGQTLWFYLTGMFLVLTAWLMLANHWHVLSIGRSFAQSSIARSEHAM